MDIKFNKQSILKLFITLIYIYISLTSYAINKILFIPLDDRPACLQIPKTIAQLADIELVTPPKEFLGGFYKKGDCDRILDWLNNQYLSLYDSVIMSTDMLIYGGLIASRDNIISPHIIDKRLKLLTQIKRRYSSIPFYAYSTIMRLAPTYNKKYAKYYASAKKYFILEDQANALQNEQDQQEFKNIKSSLPAELIQNLKAQRHNKHRSNLSFIDLIYKNVFDYLVFCQDDAAPYGPHRTETEELYQACFNQPKISFIQGADQVGSLLISRAILVRQKKCPKIKIVFSDLDQINKPAAYESKSVYESTVGQILTSGAVLAEDKESYDYKLYVNFASTPNTNVDLFKKTLKADIDQNIPLALAEIDLNFSSKKDLSEKISAFNDLYESQQLVKLISYSAWNTAANTLGTAIPITNLFTAFLDNDNLYRKHISWLTRYKFLLRAFVDDYGYNAITRLAAREKVKQLSLDEFHLTDEKASIIKDFVFEQSLILAEKYFNDQFKDKIYNTGSHQYQITSFKDFKTDLPWNRIFEASIDFTMIDKPL